MRGHAGVLAEDLNKVGHRIETAFPAHGTHIQLRGTQQILCHTDAVVGQIVPEGVIGTLLKDLADVIGVVAKFRGDPLNIQAGVSVVRRNILHHLGDPLGDLPCGGSAQQPGYDIKRSRTKYDKELSDGIAERSETR